MKKNKRSLTRLLSLMLAVTLLLAISTPNLAQEIDPWAEEEAAAQEGSQSADQPAQPDANLGPVSLGEGHMGYDKASGQRLVDPAITVNPVLSAQPLADMQAVEQDKLAQMDTSQVRFRSGLTMQLQPGITPEVLAALQGTDQSAAGSYMVIQFDYPFPTQARLDLEAAGVSFYDYVEVGGLLARTPPSALDALQKLVASGQVRAAGIIPAQANLSPDLAALAISDPQASSAVTVLTYEAPTPAQMVELGKLFTIEQTSFGPVNILEGQAVHAELMMLSALEYVRWIEAQPQYTPGNFDGGMGIGADVNYAGGIDGSGVNVMVIDTGIARSGATYHPDLLAGRILDQWDYQNNDSVANDDNGHGTHVAGSIGGLTNAGNGNSERKNQGVAPGVSYNIYKLCCNSGGTGFADAWFQSAIQRGTSGGRVTNVSNNSWGGGNGIYTVASEIADRAVRGEYNAQYLNMVIISHNDNALTQAPGTAKNVITVGAVKDGNWPASAVTTCGGVEDYDWPPGERICFSNYGPIDTDGDGRTRVKPEVMAPGTMITSAWPWYLGGAYYNTIQGTSMAAPHVTGAVAQWIEAHVGWSTWPEVTKAVFVASAIDVGGNSGTYGFGLVDPFHAIYNQGGVNTVSWWGDYLNTTGQMLSYTFAVPSGYDEVRVALTWPDPAGSTEMINDLDLLSVTDGGGNNVGSSNTYDLAVEYAKIGAGHVPGTWTVTVKGFSLSSSQSFGLATQVIQAVDNLTIGGLVEYIGAPSFSVNPGSTFYFHQYVSNLGYAAGGGYARLALPAGFTVEGVRIYQDDGYSYLYDDSEIYHPAGSNLWQVAIGEVMAGHTRHVRWFLTANSNAKCGAASFQSQAYNLDGGALDASATDYDQVAVTCKLLVPMVRQ